MHDERQLPKAERQKLIVSLVERMQLRTQQDVLDTLQQAGCAVTQATVSRDIRELGLVKLRDPLGRMRYALPGGDRRTDPRTTLQTLLVQFGRSIVAAQNIVLVHSEIGSAPAIARALDRCEHPLVLGTLAGDDTCIVVAGSAGRARELVRELEQSIREL